MLKLLTISVVAACTILTGCASVPLAPKEQDTARKTFAQPESGKSGLYIYRNSFVGQALKKNVWVDGTALGETANKVYFYRQVVPGAHKIATESEFGNNEIDLLTKAGQNYFVEQYIRMGVFVGGANVREVTEEEGKKNVLESSLAQ